MKIGAIVRSEYARGLAIQTKNFVDHMPVERVLSVKMTNPDCALAEGWYPGATEVTCSREHTLDERLVREWMEGLDVVFTVETPYDWSLPRWAREMKVKTVIQGNPEFVRHGQVGYGHHEHPDAWWWPTSWRLANLPPGIVMPVPMPDHEPTAAEPFDGGPLRIYHIAGKRAFADRNGTDTVINSLRALREDIIVTMHGLDHSLPEIDPVRNLTVNVERVGVADRWDMHRDQHLLVMPRRYGGLCLPVLEAASRGIAVLMTDVSPNEELASRRVPVNIQRTIRVAAGEILAADVHHFELAQEINAFASDRDYLSQHMRQTSALVTHWSTMKEKYMEAFARVLGWM